MGVDSSQIAVYQSTGRGLTVQAPGYTVKTADGKHLSATCVLNQVLSFESVRMQMYQAGEIGPYEIGKTTSEEILKVLVYRKQSASWNWFNTMSRIL